MMPDSSETGAIRKLKVLARLRAVRLKVGGSEVRTLQPSA